MDTQKIILHAKQRAKWNTIIVLLTIILAISPIIYMLSITYYAANDRANNLIARTTALYALTDPAVDMNPTTVQTTISPLFNLTFEAELEEQYAGQDYTVGSYEAHYGLTTKTAEKIAMNYPTPADQQFPKYFTATDFQLDMKEIPDDKWITVFAIFNKNYTEDELQVFLRHNVSVLWSAVDTGLEEEILTSTADTYPLIGYPMTKSVDGEQTEESFLKQLERLAESPQQPIDLAAKKRLAYVKEHGISIYGGTLSLKGSALKKLMDMHLIQKFKLLQEDM
ncbi:hypothetical protein QI30_07945 [Kurthia sp. 3B1D]|uniref:Sigma factor regulator C-terminal domain-containing protein n=1 Tax=Candidatus Kurthia intestinigallinarum TaxID=1562256 RepID=A0A433RUN8_9BACL|nr:anti sigma factor C-terminal domain-containing protein [Kurthia sp. 3B1D]RUS56992.1 hypothetical protein QI30_07945 [Kurthia sp. 3B1D]